MPKGIAKHRGVAQDLQRDQHDLKFKDQILKEHNIKLGFMPAFARASVLALEKSPRQTRASRATRSFIAIMSISASRLLRPRVSSRLRNAEAMGFLDIEKGIAELSEKQLEWWRLR